MSTTQSAANVYCDWNGHNFVIMVDGVEQERTRALSIQGAWIKYNAPHAFA